MRAGIIAAGQGERLIRGGIRTPKALVQVNGVPLIEHTLGSIRAAGVRDVVCIVNEDSATVETHCRQRALDLSLTFIHRTTPSSMESLFALAPYLSQHDAAFLLLTVDAIVAPAGMRDFVTAAMDRRDADGVLAVNTFIDDEKPLRVTCDASGRVTALGHAAAESAIISAGFYVFRPKVFDEIATARAAHCTALRQFLAHLMARGYRLYGEQVSKTVDVDRPEDIAVAEAFIRSGYRA
jgi:NDP-sugar pyrophosphorylase family protein